MQLIITVLDYLRTKHVTWSEVNGETSYHNGARFRTVRACALGYYRAAQPHKTEDLRALPVVIVTISDYDEQGQPVETRESTDLDRLIPLTEARPAAYVAPRYDVIPHTFYFHPATGRVASIGGARPDGDGWEVRTEGWTVRNPFTTETGAMQQPWKTREDAEQWARAHVPSRVAIGD